MVEDVVDMEVDKDKLDTSLGGWNQAQLMQSLSHNGEVSTFRGNVNW
jgi:hypothetical protein